MRPTAIVCCLLACNLGVLVEAKNIEHIRHDRDGVGFVDVSPLGIVPRALEYPDLLAQPASYEMSKPQDPRHRSSWRHYDLVRDKAV